MVWVPALRSSVKDAAPRPGHDISLGAAALYQKPLVHLGLQQIAPRKPPMLTLHHLNDSRSQRILWLLEELGTPYEMKRYQRNATTRLAPPELAAVHPLGKSPIITDGDVKIAESGAIVDYIIRRYGKGKMMPASDGADYEIYSEWLHYSEGSAMLPLMLNLYVGKLKDAGAPLHPRIDSEMANHLGYVDGALKGRQFFVGNSLTGADIQMSFVGERAKCSTSSVPIRTRPFVWR